MKTIDYIRWAQGQCPEPVAKEKSSLELAALAYDEVDDRLGDEAEGDEFLTRTLWLETAIRLAPLGWTIEELEAARWPMSNTAAVVSILRDMD